MSNSDKVMSGLDKDQLKEYLTEKCVAEECIQAVTASGVDGQTLLTFSRQDVNDMMPGPAMFVARRTLWTLIQTNQPQEDSDIPNAKRQCTTPRTSSPVTPHSRVPLPPPRTCGTPVNTLEPFFHLFVDANLAALSRSNTALDQDTRNLLVRNQIAIMRGVCGTLVTQRDPTNDELKDVAKRLVMQYPSLADDNILNPLQPWGSLHQQLRRRLANTKPVVKRQGKTPNRSKVKRSLTLPALLTSKDTETRSPTSSPQQQISLIKIPPSPQTNYTSDAPSDPKDETRHEFTETPNRDVATHSPTLTPQQHSLISISPSPQTETSDAADAPSDPKDGAQSAHSRRRQCIESLKGENKISDIIAAYPEFLDVEKCKEEMAELVGADEPDYLTKVSERMDAFWEVIMFIGLSTGKLKPFSLRPNSKKTVISEGLHTIFPSKKKCQQPLLTVLTNTQDVNNLIRSDPGPRLYQADGELLLTAGGRILKPHQDNLTDGVIGLLATFYTYNLPYPAGLETVLSVLQTEVLQDSIHKSDITAELRKANKLLKDFQ